MQLTTLAVLVKLAIVVSLGASVNFAGVHVQPDWRQWSVWLVAVVRCLAVSSKHCNDVLRLSQLLSEPDRIELPDAIREDVERFCQDVAPHVTTELLAQLGVQESPDTLLAQLRKNFGG